VISLVYQDQIKHILVDENHNGCFLKSAQPRKLPGPPPELQFNESLAESASSLSLNSTDNKMNSSATSASSLSIYSTANEVQAGGEERRNSTDNLKFKTLTELVVYYSQHPIKTANFSLDVKLLYPALSERF
jgi:hypothetical protein